MTAVTYMPHKHIDMAAQLRRAKALELRVQGHTWAEVAKLAGYPTATGAFKAAQALLDAHVTQDIDSYRKLEDMRLDTLLRSIWRMCTGYTEESTDDNGDKCEVTHDPDLFAVDRAIRIADRRAKLLGLDIKPDKDDIPASVVLIREVAAPLDKL
jgi:hypothetical protein